MTISLLQENFQKKVLPSFHEKGYKNILSIPTIEKIVVNIGLGSLLKSETNAKDLLEKVKGEVALITAQSPVITKARISVAGFGIRKDQPLGLKATLRGKRMFDFLERLIHITLPRTRDFMGIGEKSIDERGNITIGVKDMTAFPEVPAEGTIQKLRKPLGLEVTIVTKASSPEESLLLLRGLGFPLKEENG